MVVPRSAVLAAALILIRVTRHRPEYFELTRKFLGVVASIYGIRPSDLNNGLAQISFSQLMLFGNDWSSVADDKEKPPKAKRQRKRAMPQKTLW